MPNTSMFFSEPEPVRAQCAPVAAGVRRIVAHNPGKMTHHGTNTYIVDTSEGLFVIDPGPVEDRRILMRSATAWGRGARES